MNGTTFAEKLENGHAGESLIARWLRSRGNWILPVYEKVIETGKGPVLFVPNGEKLIAPDLLTWSKNGVYWVETKRKSAFTWHCNTKRWTTGIDIRHYNEYQQVDAQTPFRVWLFFLQESGQAKDSPPGCPTGLFGNSLRVLLTCENHRHGNWGSGGMVYWAHESLKFLATLEEVFLIPKKET